MFFSQFLLLGFLAVCQVQVGSVAGYSNSLVMNLNAAIKFGRKTGYHSIHKRQAINIDQRLRCENASLALVCTNGLAQEIANEELRCNLTEEAQMTLDGCRQNRMGMYCGAASAYTTEELENVCSSSETNCSTECRSLLMNINEKLGCCINILLNSTEDSSLFNYTLWSSCGIEPISDGCQSSPITTTAMVGPSCDESTYQKRFISLICSNRFAETLATLETLSITGGCELDTRLFTELIPELCGVNENGIFCFEELPPFLMELQHAAYSCTNIATCSENCKVALQDFESSAGCCINVYNGSILEYYGTMKLPFLSYKFWMQCGLETPGICEASFTSGAATTSALNKIFFLLLFMLAAGYF